VVGFGIFTEQQYEAVRRRRWLSVGRVAFSLLDIGDHPTSGQIERFEEVSLRLRTSNGTHRTTFRNRFADVDQVSLTWIQRLFPPGPLEVQDRAVSHALTSAEWARKLFALYPEADFEASDVLLELIEVSVGNGERFIVEAGGPPIQYLRWPFAVPLSERVPRRYFVNGWVAQWGKRRWARLGLSAETLASSGFRLHSIPYIHPEARALSQENPRFQLRVRSVFDRSACDVLRTMNILNRESFSEAQLQAGIQAAFDSVRPGGLWIVGRTSEEDLANHATIFRRQPASWELLERIGDGSYIEDLALRLRDGE